MSRNRGKAVKLYLGPQADLATPSAIADYHNTYMYSLRPGGGQPFENDTILGGDLNNNRDATQPAPGLADANASLVVPMCMNHLGYWLDGAFGEAEFTENIAPGFNRFRYKSGAEDLPRRSMRWNLASNGSTSRLMTGFTVGSLAMSISRAAGFSQMTVEGAARRIEKMGDIAEINAPDAMPLNRAAGFRGKMRIDDVLDATVLNAAPRYNNQLDLVPFANDSEFIGDICPGDSMFDCATTLRYTSDYFADKAAEAFEDDGFFPVEYEWARPDGSKLIITAPRCRIAPSSEEISGPGGVEVQYTLKAEQSADAPMITVDLINKRVAADYI